MKIMTALTPLIATYPLLPFPHRSRIHKLHSFSCADRTCYVKRDDELGFGISGSKLRKYLSLLPAIFKENPKEAVVMGGSFSNHVLSISQLLREQQIEPVLFLLGDSNKPLHGNALWSSLFAAKENIHWISRGNWENLDASAKDYQTMRGKNGIPVSIIPKGGNCREALPGALTLAEQILSHEQEIGVPFDHVFVDAGTGMMAAALILAFAALKKPCTVHVLLIAQSDDAFQKVLAERSHDWAFLFNTPLPSTFLYKTYVPQNAPSFGATNARVFQTISRIARQEGFLTDPIFTAKLFDEGQRIISDDQLKGNILFVHSGGGLSLSGFQAQMAKT